MKVISIFVLGIGLTLYPHLLLAQDYFGGGTGGQLGTLISGVVSLINTVLIPFVLALAFLVFVWGIFKYFVAGGADDTAKEKGKSLMLYAIGGFVLILIFFGVVNLLVASIGLGGSEGGGTSAPYATPFTGPQ